MLNDFAGEKRSEIRRNLVGYNILVLVSWLGGITEVQMILEKWRTFKTALVGVAINLIQLTFKCLKAALIILSYSGVLNFFIIWLIIG